MDIMDPTLANPDAGMTRAAFDSLPIAEIEHGKLHLDAADACLSTIAAEA